MELRFITVFTIVPPLDPILASSFRIFTPYFSKIHFNIILPSTQRYPISSLPISFSFRVVFYTCEIILVFLTCLCPQYPHKHSEVAMECENIELRLRFSFNSQMKPQHPNQGSFSNCMVFHAPSFTLRNTTQYG
jgi:hypothetical protein